MATPKKSKLTSLLLRSPPSSSSTVHPGPSLHHPRHGYSGEQIQKAEQDFRGYLHEKRRLYLIQLVDALSIGAELCVKEEREKQELLFLHNFLPHLMKYFAQKLFIETGRLLSHPPDSATSPEEEERGSEEESTDEFETKAYRNFLRLQIQKFLRRFERNLRNHLGSHRKSLQTTAMDQLSSVVLERERFWREKTAKDVQNYHNLKLYEALLSQHLSAPSSPPALIPSSPPAASHATPPAPANAIKFRELTSENILRRVSFSLAEHPRSQPQSSAPSAPPPASGRVLAQAHSIEEYYSQADRYPPPLSALRPHPPSPSSRSVRTKLLERISILLHEVSRVPLLGEREAKGCALAESSSSRSGDILDRLRGEYLERQTAESGEASRNKSLSRRSREGREEAYRVLSEIRSMNLQAEMFHQRQLSLQMSLRIELNALASQLRVEQQQLPRAKEVSSIEPNPAVL
jgi:hypothetical protein